VAQPFCTTFAILTWSPLTLPSDGAAAFAVSCSPPFEGSPCSLATEHQADVCSLYGPGNVETRVRPITGRPSLLPPSLTRKPIGSPYGSLSGLCRRATGVTTFRINTRVA
jgi:hypothetical protein